MFHISRATPETGEEEEGDVTSKGDPVNAVNAVNGTTCDHDWQDVRNDDGRIKRECAQCGKFYGYVNERGGRVELHAIDKPPVEFASPVAIFEEVLAHEQKVTAMINALYELALEEKDYPSQIMLQWFIDEQVEEEASATEILEMLKMVGDKGQALFMMDRQLGARGAE